MVRPPLPTPVSVWSTPCLPTVNLSLPLAFLPDSVEALPQPMLLRSMVPVDVTGLSSTSLALLLHVPRTSTI